MLFHLTEEGWSDVVLVERDELTSGSTWHAAAQVTQFGANPAMVALKRHSIDLYRQLSADPEFPIDYHISGDMRLAHTPKQRDAYLHFTGMAKAVGDGQTWAAGRGRQASGQSDLRRAAQAGGKGQPVLPAQ